MSGRAALCFADNGVWSGYAGQEAVLPRFLSVGSADAGSLSPLVFADAPRVAAGGRLYPTAAAVQALLAGLIDQLDVPRPVSKLVCGYPAHWGSARRAMLTAAMRDVARETQLVPTASALAKRSNSSGPVLVVECAELETLASVVQPDGTVAACEIATCGLADGDSAAASIAAAAAAAATGHSPALVLLAGGADPAALMNALTTEFSPVPVQVADWPDTVRALLAGQDNPAASPASRQLDSVPPWPVQQRRVPKPVLVGAALTAVVAVAAAGSVWVSHRGSGHDSPAAAHSAAAPPASSALPRRGANIGPVQVFPPPDWSRADGTRPGITWTEFTGPDKLRLLVQIGLLKEPITFEALGKVLERETQKEPGRYVDLRHRTSLGGRDGIGYREFNGTKQEITWHVLLEGQIQISIGCGYPTGRWTSIAAECAAFVRSVQVR